MDLTLPSCLWSQRIFPSLPGSRLTILLSRCKFSTLTTRQPMVEFYLLTFPRFPLRKKEHKSYSSISTPSIDEILVVEREGEKPEEPHHGLIGRGPRPSLAIGQYSCTVRKTRDGETNVFNLLTNDCGAARHSV